ncbi:MAG: hypothetical protein ACRD0A_03490 [Acidimicrobiales bacterium]
MARSVDPTMQLKRTALRTQSNCGTCRPSGDELLDLVEYLVVTIGRAQVKRTRPLDVLRFTTPIGEAARRTRRTRARTEARRLLAPASLHSAQDARRRVGAVPGVADHFVGRFDP